MRRPVAWSLSILATSIFSLGVAACILADPPPELPKPPSRRPTIVAGSVFPPSNQPLLDLPIEFRVPVEVPDPTKPYEWRVFVDFDPLQNTDSEQSGSGGGTSDSPDLDVVRFSVNRERLLGACHRIEFVVALRFDGARSADPSGSDSITWFYAPPGTNLAGCTPYEGGVGDDAAFPDAGAPDAPSD